MREDQSLIEFEKCLRRGVEVKVTIEKKFSWIFYKLIICRISALELLDCVQLFSLVLNCFCKRNKKENNFVINFVQCR